MIEDIVRELGYLTLGTRLKRIGERLQAQAQTLLEEAGPTVPASYFPLLAALDRLGVLSVGELSQALGISQPGVTRVLDKLESEGLVKSQSSSEDRRVRSIALSTAGRQLVERSKRLAWPRIESAVADACAGPRRPLLAQLAALEDALTSSPLRERATRLMAEE
jgi:DNA-binding MarR family transcriptional regulator